MPKQTSMLNICKQWILLLSPSPRGKHENPCWEKEISATPPMCENLKVICRSLVVILVSLQQ